MKKQFISRFCGGLVSILSFNICFAQKETFRELPPVTVSITTPYMIVSDKVNMAFERMFENSSQSRWFRVQEKFLVKFILDDQENRALFTKRGELIYHISYGTEKNLPTEIRHIVKTHYYDQTITWVYKVNQNNRDIWIISMEDPKDIVMVRVEDMQMEETQRLKKHSNNF